LALPWSQAEIACLSPQQEKQLCGLFASSVSGQGHGFNSARFSRPVLTQSEG
jgi:hypothetical protein